VPGEAGQCAAGKTLTACRDQHIRYKVPPLQRPSGSDRECPKCGKPLSINIGSKGMRFVWHCGGQCDEREIRRLLLDKHGIDEACLGSYGKRQRGIPDAMRDRPRADVYEAARKCFLIDQFIRLDLGNDSGTLLRACIQAVLESDGNVKADPESLLPADRSHLAALARRSGVERRNSYRFADWWMARREAA
jgi:hypothetical protein